MDRRGATRSILAPKVRRSIESIAAHVYAWERHHERRQAVMDAAVAIAGERACEQRVQEMAPQRPAVE